LNLLSEIKKTLLNKNDNLEKLSEIDSIVSEHINSIKSEQNINNNSIKEVTSIKEHNSMLVDSNNIKVNYSENVSDKISKSKNIESESSIAYVDNDDNYEDVFSNIADTDSTNIDSIKNILNSDNEKAKNKSVYFSHLN